MTIVMAIESSCDETGVGIADWPRTAPSRCSPTRWPPASTNTPASVAWYPRSHRVRISRRWGRPCAVPSTRRVSPSRTSSRPPSDPGLPAHCWSASPRPRRTPSPGRCRSTRSTISAGTSPSTCTTTGRCRSAWPAGVRRAHQPAARAVAGRADRGARQHRRRRRGRGLRQGCAAARPRLSRRQGAGRLAREGDRDAIVFPRGMTGPRDARMPSASPG